MTTAKYKISEGSIPFLSAQEEFAERAGVALTVVRKIEQGKTNLNMEKVDLVLKMFGHELAPVNSKELLK